MARPLSYAPICLIEGEQGSGKSSTAVARIVEDYLKRAVEIFLDKKNYHYDEVSSFNFDSRVARIRQDGTKKALFIPPDYHLESDLKVFTNFHLFGIKYSYRTPAQIIQGLQDGTISYGRLTIDESYIFANAQETLAPLSKAIQKYSNTARKRHLKIDFLYPHSRMATWMQRWSWTEHILCEYDDVSEYVTLHIQRRGYKRAKDIRYYAPPYRRFFDTDEGFKLTQAQVGRAAADAQM